MLRSLWSTTSEVSYLEDYLTYSTGNECPDLFHLWGGMVTLSAAVGRKCWLAFEDDAKYPNIYVMYVGDAGNGKSHAMRKARRLLAAVGLPYSGSLETPPGMWRNMAGQPAGLDENGKMTKEVPAPANVKRVVKWADGQLRDTHCMTIMANEFINFISLDQSGWVSAFNDIYDEDRYVYRTKNKGTDILDGPYIVLIGALTTQVSSDLQKAKIISTGMARRTIFQYGQRQFDNPHPKPVHTEAQAAAYLRCVAHLQRLNLNTTAGAFVWPEDVDAWWDSWYRKHLAGVPAQAPTVRSWYATKADQMLKVAMLLSLSEGTDLMLKVGHFEAADRYFTLLEEDLTKIFGGVGRNELAAVSVSMLEYLQNLPEPIPTSRMSTSFFSSCRPPHDFDACITHLTQTGQLERKVLTVNKLIVDFIGTPKSMAAFVEALSRRPSGGSSESPSGPSDEVGPSTSPA